MKIKGPEGLQSLLTEVNEIAVQVIGLDIITDSVEGVQMPSRRIERVGLMGKNLLFPHITRRGFLFKELEHTQHLLPGARDPSQLKELGVFNDFFSDGVSLAFAHFAPVAGIGLKTISNVLSIMQERSLRNSIVPKNSSRR